MSRAKYLKLLERQVDASKRVINDLTRENHELRELLETKNEQQHGNQSREATAL